jgi:nucleoside-diphosphate-sugar epimerase
MPRIAVTGATGFVGSRLVGALHADGQEVRGLVRPGFPASDGPAEYIQGDVRRRQTARDLMDDCDAVVHLAASFSPVDDVAEIIVEGTRAVLSAAQEAGITRVIFMSCLGAEAAAHSSYLAAKWKAEQLVRGSDLPFVILRPSVILGSGDGVTKPLVEIIRSWPVIPVPGTGEHRSQPIDVDDVVRCVMTALQSEALLGEMISIGGPMFITFRQLSDLLSGQLKEVKPKVLVPDACLPLVTRFLPAGSRDLFASARLAILRQGIVASPGIVPRMFGFEPRSVVPALGSYVA